MLERARPRSIWIAFAASCCIAAGCADYPPPNSGGPNGAGGPNGTGYAGQSGTQTLSGSFHGNMGSVTDFSSDTATVTVPSSGMSFRLDTPMDAPNWAMANIVLTEPLTGDAWTPGTTRTADITQQSGDPGSRLFTFAAYWDASGSNPAQAVTGSFELPPPSTGR
jgi:hypothetical protein